MDSERDKAAVTWLKGNQRTEAIFDYVLIVLCGAVVAVSVWMETAGPAGEWLSRSGSVMVLVGAILEYRNATYLKIAMHESIRWASGVGGPVIFEWVWYRRVVQYIAHILVIVGTLVWGYGDLLPGT